MNGSRTDTQTLGIGEILPDILLCHLVEGNALLNGLLDDLIVHVGEVLHKGHVVATILQIAAEHVEHDDGTGVAHVDIVIYGWAAAIHPYLALFNGDKFLLAAAHRVENLHTKTFLL
jgi:hypothetical protein